MASSCWFLLFVWVVWWLPLILAGPEDQAGGGCSSSAKMCGNLTISNPFWLTDWETGRSCGPMDFEVNCFIGTSVLKSSGLTGFGILNISYKERSLRVVDVYKEEDFNESKSCHFPRWNTSGKLASQFKVSHANLNIIFYNCTKTPERWDSPLVEMRCENKSNTFVRVGVPYDVMGAYASYALEGCDATIMPVMGSPGKANVSDYEQLINGGFLLTWDHRTPLPTPAPA
uniref:Wall-associated receptor kinase galacturonan-binding domain-containing protein n=2 Tax=Triticum urartu TaxID=4572 RepID=A0A8R7TRI9_TRIUA